MAKKKKSNPKKKPVSFEDALISLEKIVGELEGGKIGLADALGRYEDGVKLLKSCYELLEKAERRIEQLSGVDADGQPKTEPFGGGETEPVERKSQNRARRRSSPARKSRQPRDVDDPGRLF